MANKRIKDLTEKNVLASGDYFPIDNATDGTKKVNSSKILDPISHVQEEVSGSGDSYSSSKSYAKGDLVIHDNVLYVCNSACTAGSWATNSSHFTATTLASEVTSVKQTLSLTSISSAFEFQNDASGTLKVLKSGHLVIVNFDTNLPSSYSGDSPFIFLSTTQYIAESLTFFTAMRGNSGITGTPCRGYIDTAGDIRIYCPVGSSGGIRGSFAYFC